MPHQRSPRLSPEVLIDGILAGDRLLLSRAITLVESRLPEDRPLAREVLNGIVHATGNSVRLGITGSPGVGKSTFIEAFGNELINRGHKIAVLSIDPSSSRVHGSILADKTRMETLARHPNAYVRPSPSGATLGGISARTRETMLLCEAAGFNHIIIETVGVGQSETLVRGVSDFFLLLMLAGAGDELQGIKRGIMEMADSVVITKADGDNMNAARLARLEYLNALNLIPPNHPGWKPKVLLSSAIKQEGMVEVANLIESFIAYIKKTGHFENLRHKQELQAMQEGLMEAVIFRFYSQQGVKERMAEAERKILSGEWDAQQGIGFVMGKGE